MAAPPRRVWCRNTVCPSLDIQPYTADSPFNTFHRHIRMFGSKYTIRVHWLLFPAVMRERFPIIQTPCPDARSRSSWAYKQMQLPWPMAHTHHGSHSLRFAILFGGAKGARDGDDEGQRKLTTPANLANPWSHADVLCKHPADGQPDVRALTRRVGSSWLQSSASASSAWLQYIHVAGELWGPTSFQR
ncbi:hypothetical protein FA13DRAFT_1292568 [Coprinellus micaceus]|uniref:Uncharacterized protein n=1 Tax=Coprinellus micaceus TaxID=71717 RepID=A0A4Y7SSG8_COPMI|nr:hypothetical protein FA13DRAFT_1292568 [Coprinellus micaceus]